MLCSNCGKNIPFVGEVCPYCHRKKDKDQQYTVLAFILGGILGYLGYILFNFWGAVIGFIIGCFLFIIITKPSKSEPPDVHNV